MGLGRGRFLERGDDRINRTRVDGPPCDEASQRRDAAARGAFERQRRIGRNQRLDAKPDHCRQILIAGILGMRHQFRRNRPPRRQTQALKSGGEIEPNNL